MLEMLTTLGGSKISTKISVLKNLSIKMDSIVICGGMANNFLAYNGHDIKDSLIEKDVDSLIKEIISHAEKNNCKLITPIDVVTATENGYGNRVSVENYNVQKRGGVGVIGIKTSKRNGNVIGAVNANDNDQIIMITNKGKTIRISVSDMPLIGRNTQGVRLQVLSDDEKLVAISMETVVDNE